MDLRKDNLIIVDLETTGGNAYNQRIIELGLIRVEQGRIVDTFSTLIDPQRPIPPTITSLTGISDRDVSGAPTFFEVRDKVMALLEGCLFVAHNVWFDYGFLKKELENTGIRFSAPCLCTVRLSRLLFKDQRRHDLGSVIERFKIAIPQRHRALSDARAVWEFLQILYQTLETSRVQEAVRKLTKTPTFPPQLNIDKVNSLPETSGVYILYDQTGRPLYVGRGLDIRRRVLSHFSDDHSSERQKAICQQTADVEARQTSGELGALLLETQLIKTLLPLHNRRMRRAQHLTALKRSGKRDGYLRLRLESAGQLSAEDLPKIFALFRSRREAKKILDEMARVRRAGRPLLGQEEEENCFYLQADQPRRADYEKDLADEDSRRIRAALARYRIRPWPFAGPVMIKEEDPLRRCGEVFVLDRWCLADSVHFDEGGHQPFLDQNHYFDLDVYNILSSYLSKHPHQVTVLPDKDLAQVTGANNGQANEGFIYED